MMTISKRLFILLTTIILFEISLSAQTNNKDVTVTSSGSGKTLEDAKQAALRSATEQTFGAFISSKTEMFNDQVVADQMASVSSGNIKSFEILNQDQFPDGRWGLTLKATVSVDKLTSFVQAKGVEIEIKGGLFALNIKQQLLNEQGEIQAINLMAGLLHEAMQTSFDYEVKNGDPKSLDAESINWKIPLEVTATCNKNIDFCANYFKKTLAALSLTEAELETYQSLNKQIFPVNVTYQNQTVTYFIRKESSIDAILAIASNWEFYTRLFAVQSGMDESYGNGLGIIYKFTEPTNEEGDNDKINVKINFPTSGIVAATFKWNDQRTLSQIEQLKGYSVEPRGAISNKLENFSKMAVFSRVEQMPQFGSIGRELLEYINNDIEYPTIARKNGIQGTVVIQFIVDKDGIVREPQVVREVGGGCDEEALRVIKSMPLWIPGKQEGKPVNVGYTLPVQFKLSD